MAKRPARSRLSRRPARKRTAKSGQRSARRPSRRSAAARRSPGLLRRLWRWSLGLATLGLLFMVSFLTLLWFTLPDVRPLPDQDLDLAVQLVDREGRLIATYGNLAGVPIRAEALPEPLTSAIIAIEDRRFYGHFGVDLRGFTRAMLANVRARRIVQGGSTITQQLAKNLFLTPERTVWRKVQEMLLAVKLEVAYSKEEILAAYMNRVYLGARTYGFSAAAQRFFAQDVEDLTLYQGAVLAGLLQAPSRTNPAADEDAAIRRAGIVLNAMARENLISRADANALRGGPTNLLASQVRRADAPESLYFADLAFSEFSELASPSASALVIETTLDLDLQRLAANLVEESLAANGSAHQVSQAAVVILGLDGQVRALVGGRNYRDSSFNRAVQARRQPGSTFKLFTYLAALEQPRATPETRIDDAPIQIEGWSPRNWDDQYRGNVTFQDAFAYSLNAATVRINEILGRQQSLNLARRLGVDKSPLQAVPSAPLGSNLVSLLELTRAYVAVANRGYGVDAYSVRQVRSPEGRLFAERKSGIRGQLLSTTTALEMQQLMQAAVRYGTARLGYFGALSGGKTGTTSDTRDAWFIGYVLNHPRGGLVIGVWMGNDDNQPMQNVSGGSLPADLYARLISQSLGLAPLQSDTSQGTRGGGSGQSEALSEALEDRESGTRTPGTRGSSGG